MTQLFSLSPCIVPTVRLRDPRLEILSDKYRTAFEGRTEEVDGTEFQLFVNELNRLRISCSKEEWKSLTISFQTDDLHSILLEDPCTAFAFLKHRGYPGDATILDLMCCHQSVSHHVVATSDRGRALYAASTTLPAAEAVRTRRRELTKEIDQLASARPSIFSLAGGFAREIEGSMRCKSGTIGEFVCLDQDPFCAETIRGNFRHDWIQPVVGSLTELWRARRRQWLGRFDLAYSTGLLDYLPDPIARRAIEGLIRIVKPGGTILLANFTPDTVERGYMEAVMDWWLIYRTCSELTDLVAEAHETKVADSWTDPTGCIAYVRLLKQ